MLRSKRLFSNLKPIVNLSRNMSGYNKSHKDHIFKLIESNLVQKSIDMEYKSKIIDEIIEFENRKLFLKRNERKKRFLKFEEYCLRNLRNNINKEFL